MFYFRAKARKLQKICLYTDISKTVITALCLWYMSQSDYKANFQFISKCEISHWNSILADECLVRYVSRTVQQTAPETIPLPPDITVKSLSSLHFTPIRNTFQALCLANPKTEPWELALLLNLKDGSLAVCRYVRSLGLTFFVLACGGV